MGIAKTSIRNRSSFDAELTHYDREFIELMLSTPEHLLDNIRSEAPSMRAAYWLDQYELALYRDDEWRAGML